MAEFGAVLLFIAVLVIPPVILTAAVSRHDRKKKPKTKQKV